MNIDEIAEYYDTHDVGDEPGELTEVEPARSPSVVYSVRLSPEEAARLRAYARQHRLRDRTVARQWLLERLAEEERTDRLPARDAARRALHSKVDRALDETLDQLAG